MEKALDLFGQLMGVVLTGIVALLLFVFLAAFIGCSPHPLKQYRVGTLAGNYCIKARGYYVERGCTFFRGTDATFCGQVAVVEVPLSMECPTYFIELEGK